MITGVGEINKLYSALMVSVRALKESSDYGLSLASSTRARVQEIMLQIYNWFGMGTTIDGQATPAMLPSKNGLISRAGKRKTTDYGVRAVISAPNLRVERLEDMPVTLDYTAELYLNNVLTFIRLFCSILDSSLIWSLVEMDYIHIEILRQTRSNKYM